VRATPKGYGHIDHIQGGGGADCASNINCATPKFYKFAQLKATHPTTRLAAHKLPPEQHTWMGGIDHGKRHACSPYAYTIFGSQVTQDRWLYIIRPQQQSSTVQELRYLMQRENQHSRHLRQLTVLPKQRSTHDSTESKITGCHT
jgi:hypothetical protein